MRDVFQLASEQRWALLEATAAHLDLVVEALIAAVVLGVPLGILAARSRRLETVVVGVANVLQTVPSLALLGFLLILFRGTIGKPPALAALVIYALLPIIKNTVLGLRGIDRGVHEAALGMGMTSWQRLRLVELPLAVPAILGGIRVAAVAAVGMATIAAAIGAKGLGSFIFRGVSLSDSRLILLGSVPAALLALACDGVLGELERILDPTRRGSSARRVAIALTGCVALGSLTIFGYAAEWRSQPGANTIVIGSKDAGEPILLAHMLKEVVESRTGIRVSLRLNLGGTLVCYNALKRGGIDAYVEYTGTALTTILKEPPRNDPQAVLARVREICAQRDGIRALDSLGFENTFAILMRREQAARLGISSLSDLRDRGRDLRPGFGPEFMNRPDGYPGLVQAYGLRFNRSPREMDRNLLYTAVAQGSIDVAAGDSTDGRIASLNLVVLNDDRRYFPPYEAVPLVREATMKRFPELGSALNALAGRLSAETMRRLNYEVDAKKRDPAEVAREFLTSARLPRR
jgi:osmoprotectant transport system permease protein